MKDAIERFADHIVETNYSDIPDRAIQSAKTFILDTLGVGLAGSTGPYVKELLNAYSSAPPTELSSRVLGQRARINSADAALINGFQIHNSEFDCVHEEAVIHTMTVLLAVLLADADRRGNINGKELLKSAILGVDVACNLGVACTSGLQFFRPATAGAFAAVAAVGSARGYDKERLIRAFSLAYIQLSGTMQAHTEGSSLLALQIGFNSRNALIACDLAENGLPGLQGVLEGRFGYFGLIEAQGDIRSVLSTLGKTWRINEVAHKPFPSGRATHGIVNAIQEIQNSNIINVDQIESVEAKVPSLTHHLVGRPIHDAMEISYARLNGQFAASIMLQKRFIDIDDFTIDAIRNKSSLDLARKVHIKIDDNPDPNALSPVEVEIRMENGEKFFKRVDTVYGNPNKPLTRDAHLAKFRRNWKASAISLPIEDGEEIIKMIDDLEEVEDIRALIDLATG
jgi:2-methylcitrate dehydratase PrpD|tara:strand:+ start:94 stop:1458 length:1365 start_codon:yes stop_codon:yes gene_type:complete